MKIMRYLIFLALCLISTDIKAQDMALASDSLFLEYAKSLKNKGNDCYMLSNRIGIKRILDEFSDALKKRKAAGILTQEMEDLFQQDIRKLSGDYHYENSDFDEEESKQRLEAFEIVE